MDGLRRRNSQEAAIGIARGMLRRTGRGSFIALLSIGMLAGYPGDHQALTSKIECCSPQSPSACPQLAGLPRGTWGFSAGPTARPGYPVDVPSVTSDACRGLAVTKVQLKNRSAKTVVAVRLTWDVVERSNPNHTLLQGQTSLIWLKAPLRAGEEVALEHPIIAFADIAASWLAPGSGALSGEYRLQVSVSEVVYADGSRWTKAMEPAHSALGEASPTPRASSMGCPHQGCFWNPQYECYTCRTSEGFGCTIQRGDCLQCTE